MGTLHEMLARWRVTGEWVTNVTSWRIIEATAPRYAPYPGTLRPQLVSWLQRKGIQLYTHQAEAVEHAIAGRHVIVATPTASGKTLCYNLPVLDRALTLPDSRALYLFPTKAVAHDQMQSLRAMVRELELVCPVSAYDGDTPRSHRSDIRTGARILLSNPDMLHYGLLPAHTRWRDFLAHLDYVVVDELHVYRGVFGSHVANVLRRLRRLCRFYGSEPRFICCSATISQPGDLAQRLTGESFAVVDQSGAPTSHKEIVFYNPPVVDRQFGLRRPAFDEARRHINWLLDRDLQTVAFCPSRRLMERLVITLRQDCVALGRDPSIVRGYRGGYLPQERRDIEDGLRRGSIRAVIATNALELGVDIGGLAVCVLVGYPGSISSTWQRMGRAGRGQGESAAILMASASPLDQYIVAHPDYFYSQRAERALLNPDNEPILMQHLRCGLYELPLVEGETLGGADVSGLLSHLAQDGVARLQRGRWYWAGAEGAARDVSLRSATPCQVSIVVPGDPPREIGQIDRDSAPAWVHEGAIYLHEGEQYLVEKLDWGAGVAEVRAVSVDYMTEASSSTGIAIGQVDETRELGAFVLSLGNIRLTSRVTGYRRIRLESQQHLGWGVVDLPEQSMVTTACWITLPDTVVQRLSDEDKWLATPGPGRGPNWPVQRDRARRRDGYRCVWCGAEERPGHMHDVHHIRPFREFDWVAGENDRYEEANALGNLVTLCPVCHRKAEQQVAVQSTMAGLGRVMRHLLPLFLLCAVEDVGIHAESKAPQTGLATLFMYDRVPGGIGLSDAVPAILPELLSRAVELVSACPCGTGCPSCIGAEASADPHSKARVLALVGVLLESY